VIAGVRRLIWHPMVGSLTSNLASLIFEIEDALKRKRICADPHLRGKRHSAG